MNKLRKMAEESSFVLYCLRQLLSSSYVETEIAEEAGFTVETEKEHVDQIATPGLPLFGLEVVEDVDIEYSHRAELFMLVKFEGDLYRLAVEYNSWSDNGELEFYDIEKGHMETQTVEVFVSEC